MTKTKQEIADFINGSVSSLVVVEDNDGQVVISLNGDVTDVTYLIAKCIEDVAENLEITPKEFTDMIVMGLGLISNLEDRGEESES